MTFNESINKGIYSWDFFFFNLQEIFESSNHWGLACPQRESKVVRECQHSLQTCTREGKLALLSTLSVLFPISYIKIVGVGLPWWLSCKESACQCRRSLIWEDPMCCGKTTSMCHSYWTCVLQPASRSYWAHVPAATEPMCPQLLKLAPQHEKPSYHN